MRGEKRVCYDQRENFQNKFFEGGAFFPFVVLLRAKNLVSCHLEQNVADAPGEPHCLIQRQRRNVDLARKKSKGKDRQGGGTEKELAN